LNTGANWSKWAAQRAEKPSYLRGPAFVAASHR
jgi:hypothetical protein